LPPASTPGEAGFSGRQQGKNTPCLVSSSGPWGGVRSGSAGPVAELWGQISTTDTLACERLGLGGVTSKGPFCRFPSPGVAFRAGGALAQNRHSAKAVRPWRWPGGPAKARSRRSQNPSGPQGKAAPRGFPALIFTEAPIAGQPTAQRKGRCHKARGTHLLNLGASPTCCWNSKPRSGPPLPNSAPLSTRLLKKSPRSHVQPPVVIVYGPSVVHHPGLLLVEHVRNAPCSPAPGDASLRCLPARAQTCAAASGKIPPIGDGRGGGRTGARPCARTACWWRTCV